MSNILDVLLFLSLISSLFSLGIAAKYENKLDCVSLLTYILIINLMCGNLDWIAAYL